MQTASVAPSKVVLFIAYVLRTIWILKNEKSIAPELQEFIDVAETAENAIDQGRSNEIQLAYVNAVSRWQSGQLDPSGIEFQETKNTFQQFTEFLNRLCAEKTNRPLLLQSYLPGLVLLDALYKGALFTEYCGGMSIALLKDLALECPQSLPGDIVAAWAHVISNGISSSDQHDPAEFPAE
jgi:hypothetical protein